MAITITPTPIAAGFSNFYDALYQFIKPLEGDIPFVYSDSKGIPTLGIGYALVVDTGGTPKWDLRGDYPTQLAAAGISLTQQKGSKGSGSQCFFVIVISAPTIGGQYYPPNLDGPCQAECISSRIASRTTSASDNPSAYCFNASFIMV